MRNKKWTEEEITFIKDNYLRLTDRQLSVEMNRTYRSVRTKRFDLQLTLPETDLLRKRKENFDNMRKKVLERRGRKKIHLPGYSIYSITYFAYQDKLIHQKNRSAKSKSLTAILEEIATIFQIDLIQIKSKTRKEGITFCRQIFCYIAKRLHPKIPLVEIAAFVGYKEHTVVIHNIQRVNDFLRVKDPSFMEDWYKYLGQTQIFKK